MLPSPAALATLVTRSPEATGALAVEAPFTGRPLGHVPEGTAACVALAAGRARAAQPAWAARPVGERAAVVVRFLDLLLRHRAALLDLMQDEAGKARRSAAEEVVDVLLNGRYYAVRAAGLLGPHRRRGVVPGLTHVTEGAIPVGVVGVIAPWNYPLTVPISDALPALLAGNAVVLKPSELTPFTALAALVLLRAAGLPDDVLQVVTGYGEPVGAALVEAADFVQFTGSTAVGRRVAEVCGRRLVPCSMELGGKNPALVLADADVGVAAEGLARGAFANAGQLCIHPERIFVDRSVYARFRDAFAARAAALVVGPGRGWDVEVGSLASLPQLRKVEAHVADAVAKGARVLAGGHARPDLGPLFYAPTVLEGVAEGMDVWADETFGPVVSLYPFDTEDEAVARANGSAYGLNASVWTRDAARGRALARRLRCGTVGVNDPYGAAWGSTDAPMGGVGASGLGRRHGAHGLLKYTEPQTVAVQRGRALAPGPGEPPGPFFDAFARAAGFLRHVPGLR